MTAQSRTTLKTYFETGDRPTQTQFGDLIDSFAILGETGSEYIVDEGVNPNVYVITPSPPITAYTSGLNYAVKFSNTNTSASTININSLGAVSITYNDGSTLTGGELPQNGVGTLFHNGTNFVITNINPSTTGAITSLTGDISATGPGSVSATFGAKPGNSLLANITAVSAAPAALTVSASRLVGRGSSGNLGEISLGTGLSFSGSTLNSTSGSMVVLQTQVVSAAVASVDFTTGIDSTYKAYVFVLTGVTPETNSDVLYIRTGNGGSFDSGSSNYAYGFHTIQSGGTDSSSGSTGATQISATDSIGNDSTAGLSGIVYCYDPSNAGKYTHFSWYFAISPNSTAGRTSHGSGARLEAAAHDRVRFLMNTGNIVAGTFTLYGLAGES